MDTLDWIGKLVTYHLLCFAAFPVAFWCCHLEPAEFVFASLSEFPAPAEKGKREGKGTHVNEMNGKSLIIKVKVVQSIPAVECMYTMGWNPFWRSILKVLIYMQLSGSPQRIWARQGPIFYTKFISPVVSYKSILKPKSRHGPGLGVIASRGGPDFISLFWLWIIFFIQSFVK